MPGLTSKSSTEEWDDSNIDDSSNSDSDDHVTDHPLTMTDRPSGDPAAPTSPRVIPTAKPDSQSDDISDVSTLTSDDDTDASDGWESDSSTDSDDDHGQACLHT